MVLVHNYPNQQLRARASSSRWGGSPTSFLTRNTCCWSAIARLLGVSWYTVYRQRDEFNLSDEPDRTMTDAQLEMRVRELRRELPTFGEALVIGTLRSSGHRVTRDRVRRAIHATDPINTAMRWRGQCISRRPYSVPGPNSLWHIGEMTCMSVAYYIPASARVIRFVAIKSINQNI